MVSSPPACLTALAVSRSLSLAVRSTRRRAATNFAHAGARAAANSTRTVIPGEICGLARTESVLLSHTDTGCFPASSLQRLISEHFACKNHECTRIKKRGSTENTKDTEKNCSPVRVFPCLPWTKKAPSPRRGWNATPPILDKHRGNHTPLDSNQKQRSAGALQDESPAGVRMTERKHQPMAQGTCLRPAAFALACSARAAAR